MATAILSHDMLEIVHKVTKEFKWCDIPSDEATFKCLVRLADSRKIQWTNDLNRQIELQQKIQAREARTMGTPTKPDREE